MHKDMLSHCTGDSPKQAGERWWPRYPRIVEINKGYPPLEQVCRFSWWILVKIWWNLPVWNVQFPRFGRLDARQMIWRQSKCWGAELLGISLTMLERSVCIPGVFYTHYCLYRYVYIFIYTYYTYCTHSIDTWSLFILSDTQSGPHLE